MQTADTIETRPSHYRAPASYETTKARIETEVEQRMINTQRAVNESDRIVQASLKNLRDSIKKEMRQEFETQRQAQESVQKLEDELRDKIYADLRRAEDEKQRLIEEARRACKLLLTMSWNRREKQRGQGKRRICMRD